MTGKHCFISERGDLLPRWREAFPNARAAAFERPPKSGRGIGMIWLRLARGKTPASMLASVRTAAGEISCVILSDEPNDEEALACFAAAARGYCNTHAAAPLLLQIAAVVEQGGLWIGESLMQRLLGATARLPLSPPGTAAWDAGLTEREREVAGAVAGGASNKEIARQLGITERTVKAHVGAVLEKLGVRDRLQLALRVNSRPA